MTTLSPHEWLQPRLAALMDEAQQAGIARDVSVAVITDLVNGKLASATPTPADQGLAEEGWNQDIGEPLTAVNGPPDTAPDQSSGEPMPNPLNHLGRRGY